MYDPGAAMIRFNSVSVKHFTWARPALEKMESLFKQCKNEQELRDLLALWVTQARRRAYTDAFLTKYQLVFLFAENYTADPTFVELYEGLKKLKLDEGYLRWFIENYFYYWESLGDLWENACGEGKREVICALKLPGSTNLRRYKNKDNLANAVSYFSVFDILEALNVSVMG